MGSGTRIGVPWLPLFWMLGAFVAYFVLSRDDRLQGGREMWRVILEVAALGGTWYWLVLWLLGFSQSAADLNGDARSVAFYGLVEVCVWGLVAWPFAAWRMERVLRVPFYRSSDLTTRLCGWTAGAYLLTTGVRLAARAIQLQ